MTPDEAIEIADEQIAHWRNRGWTAAMAWQALGQSTRYPRWDEVETWMVRWLWWNEQSKQKAA